MNKNKGKSTSTLTKAEEVNNTKKRAKSTDSAKEKAVKENKSTKENKEKKGKESKGTKSKKEGGRKLTAYNVFMREERPNIIKDGITGRNEVFQEIAKRYKNLSEKEKKKFQDQADAGSLCRIIAPRAW
jgi:hypothetical protein